MQTLEFTRSLTQIISDLKVRELHSLMNSWLIIALPQHPNQPSQNPLAEDQKRKFESLLFESHAGYDRLSRIESTGKILAGMDAQELYEPARLARIMNLVSSSSYLQQLRGNHPDIFDFFETLKAFIRMEKTCNKLLAEEKIGTLTPANAILELQLTDYEEQGIDPDRLIAAVSNLTKLQMNLSRLLAVESIRLKIKYIDSGSDLIIAIEGAKALIESMGNLFLQFWDKVRFRDQDTFEKDMEALSKGLDFLSKAKEAVDTGAITEEEANNLKVRVFRGVNDLVGLGVTLPFKEDSATDDRRQLIEKRSTKLLTTGSDVLAAPQPPDEVPPS